MFRFYAHKETADELQQSITAKVLLIGGFAGYWNLGDTLQLRGTIRWYQNAHPSAMVCPFVQLGTVGDRDSLTRLNGLFGTEHWILYAPSEDPGVPVRAQSLGVEPLVPANTRSPAILHVYGGGFFNRWWGDWMLRLIECVLRSVAVDEYLISGQQVGADFADKLSSHCRLFRPQAVGCRDAQSNLLLRARGVEAFESGDDALEEILLIARSGEPGLQSAGPDPSFGLHLNLSPYSISTGGLDSEREPDQIGEVVHTVDGYVRLLLDRYGESVCPVIIGAYPDQRAQVSDSWRSMDRALLAKYFPYFMGMDLVAMWKQARLSEAAAVLRVLQLCVSSSYHVALLAQSLHVPTYLLAWNDYYRQKQRGLMQSIPSFQEFVSGDPRELVAEQAQSLSAHEERRERWLSRLGDVIARTAPTGSPRLPPNRPAEGQPVASMGDEQPEENLERCAANAWAAWDSGQEDAMQDALQRGPGARANVTEGPATEPVPDGMKRARGASTSRPLVSVVIPTYNHAEFVGSAVQSALDQKYPKMEVIVVDDGSTDNTREVLKPYLGDRRVSYLSQENRGPSSARNRGIAESKGEYLNFLDADDYFHPSKVAKQVEVLQSDPSVDLVYCDVALVDRNGRTMGEYSVGASRKILEGDIFDSLMLGGYYPPHVVLLRRTVLEQVGVFDEELKGAEDWDLWLRASAEGFRAHYIDEKLAYYRRYPGTISQHELTMQVGQVAVMEKMAQQYPARLARSLVHLISSNKELNAGNEWLRKAYWELVQSNEELKGWAAGIEKAYRDLERCILELGQENQKLRKWARGLEEAHGQLTQGYQELRNWALELERAHKESTQRDSGP